MNYEREIYTFASNCAGRHGKGSALEAKQKHGAIYGIGIGLQGNAYAIPTKDAHLKVLPLKTIAYHVKDFIEFARKNPTWRFNVVKIGCGLAGYKESEISPMFAFAPSNVFLPDGWAVEYNSDNDPMDGPLIKLFGGD